jgi:CelD/BcsL family acetyltransferase involved in cellulose biosynthesis
MTPVWSMHEYGGRAGLLQLEADWRRLYSAMPRRAACHPFEANFAYVDLLMENPDELRCLALSDGHEVRSICALEPVVDRVLGPPIGVWRTLAPPHLPHGDLIGPEDDARRVMIPEIVRHLRREPRGRHLLLLGPLPQSTVLWDGLRWLKDDGYLVEQKWSDDVLDCSRPIDELTSKLRSNFRRNLRRRSKKLHALPGVDFVSARAMPDLEAGLETFLDLEASGWKGESGTRTAIRFKGNQPAFYHSLLTLQGAEDYCEINALYADGKCIASQFCMRTGTEYELLKIGYDEAYRSVSPGQLLVERLLERACQDPGLERLNLVGNAAWHQDWAPDSVPFQHAYFALGDWSGPPLMALLRLRFGPGRRAARAVRARSQQFVKWRKSHVARSADRLPDLAHEGWSLREHRGRQALEVLEPDWRRLYCAMPQRSGFHAIEAHAAYADNLMRAPGRLRCLVLLKGAEVRAICPLEARTDRILGLPVRVWGIPWHPHWPLSDVICPEDEARRVLLPLLVSYLRSRREDRHILTIGPLPGSSVLWDGLFDLDPAGFSTNVPMEPFVFDCRKPLSELLARLSRHFRKELRRTGRRLESLEGVRYETARNEEDLAAAFEDFLEVEGSGWKGEAGTGSAIRLHAQYASFYRSLAHEFDDGDGCEISTLYAEGRCIAGEFSMRTGEEYATLKIGYDEEYSRLSPGHLLCAKTLARCCDDPQIKRFNQLSDAEWIKVWRPDRISYQQAHIALDHLFGRPFVAALRLRFGPGRRVARWLRRSLARRS